MVRGGEYTTACLRVVPDKSFGRRCEGKRKMKTKCELTGSRSKNDAGEVVQDERNTRENKLRLRR